MIIDRPIVIAIVIGVVLSAALDWFRFPEPEFLFAGSDVPLFWVGFGLAGCIGIVVISKWVGHTFLMKHDDPYTGEHVEAEPGEHGDV